MPMSKFLMIVNQVAFPAYSRLQSDVPLAREYFFKSVRLTALLFFPLLWGLSSVSAEFVETFLGDQWIAGSLCLAIVTLAVPFRVMSMLLSPVVDGLGHPGVGLRNLLTFSALLPAAMAVGTNWGIVGVSCGLVGASAVALIINFHRSLPLLGSSLREMFHSLVPSMLSGAVMYGAVLTTKVYLLAGMAAPGRLAVLIAVGAGVYGAMTMLINRDVAFGSVRLLRAGA